MTGYPEVLDCSPLHIDAQKLHEVCARYGDDADALETVALAIAGYANPRGDSFPGLALLSRLTGYTIQEVSRLAHILQAAGVFIIRKVKEAGARYAHNCYHFAKSFSHRVADVTSAHFIGNLQKWKAKAEDVAAAVKEKARVAVDTVVEQAAKLAAVFEEKPELMESPKAAAALAGIEEPETVEIPAVSEPVQTATQLVGDGMASQPVQSSEPVPACYKRETSHVFASWRDRVAAYREKPESAIV